MANDLDAHAKPPARLREVYKEYQKLKPSALDDSPNLIQFDNDARPSNDQVVEDKSVRLPNELREILSEFLSEHTDHSRNGIPFELKQTPVYQVPNLPGLLIYPSLLPPQIQLSLLDRLLHRDISNPAHKTNVHLHHHVPYPQPKDPEAPVSRASYFDPSSSNLEFPPKDPTLHKPLSTPQFLSKKLRWCTLGGQYDWTAKQYPSSTPPPFPPDLKSLIETIFPMRAEAAILNLYSPGDTLSLHRDVSEECGAPLVSISLGCDAVFVCGLGEEAAVLRLRSGDAVLMSGESRYAWHGVPKIVEGTCPAWMEGWPGEEFGEWEGWMRGKRVNLNVRQMFA
ncbi:hypothetical protein PRZ48_002148 [Zasmidium cellare]|uniref:Fe2OG dioxygenase domain-containing protein n=1 Tax=Zasmidium cellare TaxID=395010 RepID=A0ABR0F562_ZASCE|nr:hypothetical protein PRZ48_002148 [Zasmidium cellare]